MSDETPGDRRRVPPELHLNTILTGVTTAAITFVGYTLFQMSGDLKTMQAAYALIPSIYALKAEVALEADKRRELEIELREIKARMK
jgi:hypothetical protein